MVYGETGASCSSIVPGGDKAGLGSQVSRPVQRSEGQKAQHAQSDGKAGKGENTTQIAWLEAMDLAEDDNTVIQLDRLFTLCSSKLAIL